MMTPTLAGNALAAISQMSRPALAVSRQMAPRDLSEPDQEWISGAQTAGGTPWLNNADATVYSAFIGDHRVPVTVLRGSPAHSSYVSSPHAAWISYPFTEAMTMVHGWRRPLAQLAALTVATPLVGLMMAARLDRAAIVANYFVSTNLHPRWNGEELLQATQHLVGQFPDRPLLMRSICPAIDPHLSQGLITAGWRLVPARQIYLVDPRDAAVWRHNHLKRDRKLLNATDLTLTKPQDIRADDLPTLRALFHQLFIDKHCALNPDYTPDFFTLCRERRFLELYALCLDGRPVGVLGILERHGWITTPLIGYETGLPQNLGIYRRLMALLYVEAQRRECQLHLSSGAGSFKSARGGKSQLEYTAIYDRHLGIGQRAAIAGFAAFMQRAVPWALARAEPKIVPSEKVPPSNKEIPRQA